MNKSQFHAVLLDYLSNLVPLEETYWRTEFYIHSQPAMTSYGGHFVFQDGHEVPIDLRRKSKSANDSFATNIELFHRESTDLGMNKWNKAIFRIDRKGNVAQELLWDDAWEQREIEAYRMQSVSPRPKWYWEEDDNAR